MREVFERIEWYFSAALEIDDEEERFAWVEKALSDEEEILKEVCSLLIAHHESDSFLVKVPPLKEAVDNITERCPDLTGRRLGVYEVICKIARGGMGRIYSAKRVDGEYEQMVAIKVVEVANLETELFLKERQFLADIQHPNIVTLLDGGTLEEGFPYLVMEFVDGVSIDGYVRSLKLTLREQVKLCSQLCGVVEDAHQQGVIHCDLKPDNILVINKGNRQGTLKLLDFGIAQSLSVSNTPPDKLPRGITPEYASPQRHRHRAPHKTDDIYSLGIILGQILSNQPLFLIKKTSITKKSYQIADIATLAKSIDNKELVQILCKATANKRHARYQSAKDFQRDLDNWLDEKPINAAQGGIVYLSGKYIYHYRKRVFIIMTFALLTLLIGQMTGGYFKQQQYADVRQQEAVDAVDDLNALLSTISTTPTIEKEVTSLTLSHLQDWNKATPNNFIIKQLYANLLIRSAKVNGHPYYLNLGNITLAKEQYQHALLLYGELANLQEANNQLSSQSIKIYQYYLQHQLAELEIYETGADNPNNIIKILKKMSLIRKKLERQQFKQFSSKQRLLVASMALAGAYESLRVEAYKQTWNLLLQAKKLLADEANFEDKDLEEQHYLMAFENEIRGHFYYLQGNVKSALSSYSTSYSKINRSVMLKNEDKINARHQLLLVRVYSAIACLGYLQENKSTKQHHFEYFKHARKLIKLADKYQGVPFLQQQKKKMSQIMDTTTEKGRQAFCANPITSLLLPLDSG